MKLKDFDLPETAEFQEGLEVLKKMIKTNLNRHTTPLEGERLLTKKEVEELLHVSERTLHTYRTEGKIPYIRLYGKILYKESDILKVLEKNYVSAISTKNQL